MKTLIAITLSLSLAAMPLQAQSTNAPPVEPKCTLCELMVVMGCVALAGTLVIYVYSTNGKCCANHKLVLLEDHNDGNWIPVATNIVNVCTNKMAVFSTIINQADPICRFRVQDMGVVTE